MSARQASPIHAVPIAAPPRARDHRATSTCWCRPTAEHRDLATSATVWIHKDPEPQTTEPRP